MKKSLIFVLTLSLLLLAVSCVSTPSSVKKIEVEKNTEIFFVGDNIRDLITVYGTLRNGSRVEVTDYETSLKNDSVTAATDVIRISSGGLQTSFNIVLSNVKEYELPKGNKVWESSFLNISDKKTITSVNFLKELPANVSPTTPVEIAKNLVGYVIGTDVYIVGERILANEDSSELFNGFKGLKTVDFTNYSVFRVEKMADMFYETEKLETIIKKTPFDIENSNLDAASKDYLESQLWYFTYKATQYERDYHFLYSPAGADYSNNWFSKFTTSETEITKVIFTSTKPDGTYKKNVELSLEVENSLGTDTNKIRGYITNAEPTVVYIVGERILIYAPTMLNFFKGFTALKEVDFGNVLDTSRMISTTGLFYYCSELTTIKGLDKFDTSNTVSMAGMFEGCAKLTSIDVSSFNTEKVKDMYTMFKNCTALTSLDISNFKTTAMTSTDLEASNKGLAYMFVDSGLTAANSIKVNASELNNFKSYSKADSGLFTTN